jgi:nucleotide-binding universal stress UspA family protein
VKRILIAVDGSDGSRAAVETGVELGRPAASIATVVCVTHAPLPIVADPYYHQALVSEAIDARRTVDEATATLSRAGIEVESEIRDGDPADEIVALARERDVDVIVVGSRGLGTLGELLAGSVSAAVVRRADRPVLVAKRRAG